MHDLFRQTYLNMDHRFTKSEPNGSTQSCYQYVMEIMPL